MYISSLLLLFFYNYVHCINFGMFWDSIRLSSHINCVYNDLEEMSSISLFLNYTKIELNLIMDFLEFLLIRYRFILKQRKKNFLKLISKCDVSIISFVFAFVFLSWFNFIFGIWRICWLYSGGSQEDHVMPLKIYQLTI